MNETRAALFHWRMTRWAMTVLFLVSVYILRETLLLRADPTLGPALWQTIPYQAEHVLAGVAAYLIFSVVFQFIQRSDNR